MSALEIRDLHFAYPGGLFRLDVRSLDIEEGEALACIGPSGSGKSTFLELVAGIRRPLSGQVLHAGEDWDALPDSERRRRRLERIGFVFQSFDLFEHLDALGNVLLPYHVHPGRTADAAVRERAHALLERTGLVEQRKRHPAELSHGERQRVAVCRALIGEPDTILADEPTGNLDPKSARGVLDLLLVRDFKRVVNFSDFSGSDA